MKQNKLIEKLDSVKALVEKWEESEAIPEIERDIALSSLQKIYRTLLKLETQEICAKSEESAEKEIELIVYESPEAEAETEAETEDDAEAEAPEDGAENETNANLSTQKDEEPDDTWDEEEDYQDEPLETEEEQGEVVYVDKSDDGECYEPEDLEEEEEKAAAEPDTLIFGQPIDKETEAMFVQELFLGDDRFFASEIDKLESQPDFDSALIYISEKYNWSAQSAAADSFTELLANYEFKG